ncbi:MAG: acyl-CoA desaturase [Phycisphaerae bacterium]
MKATGKFSIAQFAAWFDSSKLSQESRAKAEPLRWIPSLILHAGCLGVIWVGFSWTAFGIAILLYVVRMFAITGFYHRYFSHRTFKTSRAAQFVFAVLGNSAAQRGPIWWAAQHRKHHAHSDRPEDPHSPHEHSWYWSHMGWLMVSRNLVTDPKLVRDLIRFPELRFLDRFELIVPTVLAAGLFAAGTILRVHYPGLETNGMQLVVWGFFVSTVVLFHCTCFINSLAHLFGTRRFETQDESRNNLGLALLTLGEGWHNNHHKFPGSVRQGFYWWEVDITYYGLKLLEKIGVIWSLRPVPQRVLDDGRTASAAEAAGG